MPLVRDENLVKLYEEADKAKETIKNLSTVLEAEEKNNTLLKKQRIVLGIFSLAMLILFLWSFLPKSKQYKEEYLIENNLSFIDTDSLHDMQRKIKQINVMDSLNVTTNEMSIVYSVQIGAYANFNSKLISDDLAQLEEFEDAGYNKFAIGKFTSYKEAVQLRDDMKRLGFTDCFIIAKSYGILVNMNEALELSGEKWIRGNAN
ncbi:MAG: SPOR domain-containing protein [Flavobacteriaceae bacterium]|nr:SPOR domain-containing protein [Flavobacteriaceae bacterium]